MKAASSILAGLSSAMDDVAAGMAGLAAMFRPRRRIELIEQTDGSFLSTMVNRTTAQPIDEPLLRVDDVGLVDPTSARMRSLLRRSAVDIVLAPSRFVFRPLELPRGAHQFLEGVVRSQIDRLTPWSANEAVFGWSNPIDRAHDRISVVVAATSRTLIAPISRAILLAGADSVRVSTRAAEDLLIPLLDQQSIGASGSGRLKFGLVVALAIAGLTLVLSFGLWMIVDEVYAGRSAELQRRTAERRSAMMSPATSGGIETVRALDARKRTTPSAVMTLEALSGILPDDVYLTELRIENGKVQISGVANDAATLIRLIEQSRRFTRATFYAPTVRNADGGETFHIEGRIEPSFAVTN